MTDQMARESSPTKNPPTGADSCVASVVSPGSGSRRAARTRVRIDSAVVRDVGRRSSMDDPSFETRSTLKLELFLPRWVFTTTPCTRSMGTVVRRVKGPQLRRTSQAFGPPRVQESSTAATIRSVCPSVTSAMSEKKAETRTTTTTFKGR
ncbi:MAG: hypothetical protein IPJ34_34370 [Myxococcales bacterium]|nr:hypothetical protein [Myxococcales bacterium]